MKRIGIFVLSAAALTLQGCIFAPIDHHDGYDPFFFNPNDSTQSADFVEVGNYQPESYQPPLQNRHCSVNPEFNRPGSPCWFFPIMRVY
jgi:hypothetical protein